MLTVTITINGKQASDLAFALEVILPEIRKGFLSGFNSNDEGDYRYNVTGEPEESDDPGESDENDAEVP